VHTTISTNGFVIKSRSAPRNQITLQGVGHGAASSTLGVLFLVDVQPFATTLFGVPLPLLVPQGRHLFADARITSFGDYSIIQVVVSNLKSVSGEDSISRGMSQNTMHEAEI
jgi:hypothetical protein